MPVYVSCWFLSRLPGDCTPFIVVRTMVRKLFLTSSYSMDLIKISMLHVLSSMLHVLAFSCAVSELFNLQPEEVNYGAFLFQFSLVNFTKND